MTAIVKTVHKTNDYGFDEGLNAVLSDLTPDAYGDIVGDPAHPNLGWDISDFVRNPIALWSHDSRSPIGKWQSVSVVNGALRGNLQLAPPGSTKLVDELRALLAADVLRGISVGFKPTESKPRGNGGIHYLRQTLVEASLVSVPANPSALVCAKALGISKQTISMIFQPSDEQRLTQALNARARAMAEVKRIDDQIASEYSWEEQKRRQHEETIAAYTRQSNRLPQDPPPFTPSADGHGTWRGQKLPGPTWRGKPIR